MPDDIHQIGALFAAAGLQRPEDSIGYLLWRVSHRHQRDMDRVLADIDLTHLQFATLAQTAWLESQGNAVTQPGLKAFSNIHPMQLSLVLKTLAEKQLITRPRCANDSRAKLIVLTPAGIAALAVAMPRASALQSRFFGTPSAAAVLKDALRAIVASWEDNP